MSEQKIMKSGVAMVRISGSKVRSLREEQNLTQLYLATAVGVTTETISRWERQEAPTLKEENGQKLADVLAVSLEEILAPREQTVEEEVTTPITQSKSRISMFVLGSVVLFGIFVFLYITFKDGEVLHFSAKRLMPAHSVAGHPFPVVIEVDFVSGKNSSLLLKEQLPAGCRVLRTVPQATVADSGLLKWIDKDGPGKRSFSYMAQCASSENVQSSLSFVGSLLVRQASRQEVVVDGRSRLRLSDFHWADSDKNHIINDEELLAVYDDFGRVEGLKVDVEEVESIWMGSGYRWDSKQSVFDIIP
jgi:transcriptional regulator with XRE-family HTH domain